MRSYLAEFPNPHDIKVGGRGNHSSYWRQVNGLTTQVRRSFSKLPNAVLGSIELLIRQGRAKRREANNILETGIFLPFVKHRIIKGPPAIIPDNISEPALP